ncbi:hypothetical protein HID58_075579 [Brassica napus]|uniref:Uncharacterized protein n=1 Tax=Brassica napus TaxID=3708 RepID=A0ABQ7YLQ3_BRANA|nr:hypothetical protein HID58_075579 [Brassica napus]
MNVSLLYTMLLALALSCVCLFFLGHAHPQELSGQAKVSALFAFGDSILDTGNNNHLRTQIKCNVPYGRNFVGGKATGRFGNGRVFADIIVVLLCSAAEGLILKPLLPAYHDPNLSNSDLPTRGYVGARSHPGAKFAYVDMYISLLGLINNPQASGNVLSSSRFRPVPRGPQFCGLTKWRPYPAPQRAFTSQAHGPGISGNANVSALFAFGDSILDTGNNNNLTTLSKCNYFPYGRNFVGGKATGRFGNGRLTMIPNLSNNDLPTGVCFASGGSGLDERTAKPQGVIWVPDQVKDFKEYVTKLNGVLGNQEKTNAIISNAVYLTSAGNNDLSLYDMGARKFAVLGTVPLGCLPGIRKIDGDISKLCSVPENQWADTFNKNLSVIFNTLETKLPGAKFSYVDMYNSLLDLVNNPQASGFTEVADACYMPTTSPIPCPDASRYVFWDRAHPSEKAYQTIAPKIIEEFKDKLA